MTNSCRTHLGAMFSGIVFGFLTCPSLQLDNVSPKTTQKEGIALVQRQADPCKSLLTFTLCLLLLSLIVLNFEPQNEMLELDGFINWIYISIQVLLLMPVKQRKTNFSWNFSQEFIGYEEITRLLNIIFWNTSPSLILHLMVTKCTH